MACACAIAGCAEVPGLRLGRLVGGAGWQEMDLCPVHAKEYETRLGGAVASLAASPYTLGVAGVPLVGKKLSVSAGPQTGTTVRQ